MIDHQRRVYDSMLGLLSNEDNPTPLVQLNSVTPFEHAQVYGKLEWYNPFGAIKDRVAANMILDAEEQGILASDQKLVEPTSGNTGMGLAMVSNLKGYSLTTPLSSAIPLEKRTMLRFFGADVIELEDTLCPAPGRRRRGSRVDARAPGACGRRAPGRRRVCREEGGREQRERGVQKRVVDGERGERRR